LVTGRQDRHRQLCNAKQRRYREHFKAGFRSIRFAYDRTVVRDFLVENGVAVPDLDPQTLGSCLETFFKRWEEGELG
jgi:hypothetical protein